MGRDRARGADEKEARREAILASAATLLDRSSFANLSMSDLATELGLSKGALYLYFPTKEALFLSLLQGELGAWFTALGQALDGLKPGGEPELVADTISGSLLERPRLVRLLGLMHLVLEQNVDAPTVRTWKLWLLERLTEAGARLERALPRLSAGEGSRLLVYTHALVVGIGQMTDNGPVLTEVLAAPDLAPMRVDRAGALADALRRLLGEKVPAFNS